MRSQIQLASTVIMKHKNCNAWILDDLNSLYREVKRGHEGTQGKFHTRTNIVAVRILVLPGQPKSNSQFISY
jgi:hypothetical protein